MSNAVVDTSQLPLRSRGPRTPALVATCVALAALVGCLDSPVTQTDASPGRTFKGLDEIIRSDGLVGIEAHFAQISEDVPEFAGYHFNTQGDLVIRVTDLSKGAAVRPYTDPIAASRSAPEREVSTIYATATHSFQELRDWRDIAAANVFRRGDVRFLDIDEEDNRLVIGVTDESVPAELTPRLATAGVPSEATTYVVTGAFTADGGSRLDDGPTTLPTHPGTA